MTCALCSSTYDVHKSGRFHDLPICKNCNVKIDRYSRYSPEESGRVAKRIIGNLMCMLLAKHGYERAVDSAAPLLHIVEHGTFGPRRFDL